jgi:hypothetical protein
VLQVAVLAAYHVGVQFGQQEPPVLFLGVGIEWVPEDESFAHHFQQVATGSVDIVRGGIGIDEGL